MKKNEVNWDKLWEYKKNSYSNNLDTKHIIALEAIKYLSSIDEIKSIGDFGCGYGNVLKELSKAGKYDLFAFDQSDFAKQELEKKGIKFIQCDLLELEQKNIKLDVAILTDVLEHFFEPEKVLKGLVNCKYIIVTVPNFSEIFQRIQVLKGLVPFNMKPQRGGHVYWFNLDEFRSICQKDFYIIQELHAFPNKVKKFKFLKNYPNLFAHLFGAILKVKK